MINTKVLGDPINIRQIYKNVINNTIKFTESGSIHVTITCTYLDNTYILFYKEVRDTCIGISNIDKLFEAFIHVDISTTCKFGGSGLGLTINRDILKLMGEEIGVLSRIINESTFWFTTKLNKQHDIVIESLKEQPSITRKKTVVVLTRDMYLYTTISIHLTTWKYTHILIDAALLKAHLVKSTVIIFLCDIINLRDSKMSVNTIKTMFPKCIYNYYTILILYYLTM